MNNKGDAMNDQQYQERVTEARPLVKRSKEDQLRLAQLTWETIQSGKSHEEWSADIGVSADTTRRWYKFYDHHRNGDQSAAATFEVQPITEPDYEQKRVERGVRNLPPERKAEFVREAIQNDPEIRRAVVSDPVIYNQISEAHTEHVVEQANAGERPFRQELGRQFAEHKAQDALGPLYRLREAIGALRIRFRPEDFIEQASDRDIAILAQELDEDITFLQAIRDEARASRKPRLVEERQSS